MISCGPLLLRAVVLTANILTFGSAAAATIGVTNIRGALNRITVEGQIEKGDYERFLQAALSAGVDVDTVSLLTGGGDAFEAMRIGRLIRALGLKVEAPKHFPQGNVCLVNPKNSSNCRCDSACVFLYLGGIHRYGDAIGVHRVYLNHGAQLELSLDESKAVAQALEAETRKYFQEMGAPPSLLELVNSAASDEVRYLTTDYAEKNLYGHSHDIEEWLIARCGSASQAFTRYYQSAKTDAVSSEAEFRKVSACFDHHLRLERFRKFRSVMGNAIAAADIRNIKPGSQLAWAKADFGRDLPDIIGMPKATALRVLTTFGFGQIDPVSFKNGEGYTLQRSLMVSFTDTGHVSNVNFLVVGNPDDDWRPFAAPFANGLDQSSTPADFVAKYGKPLLSQTGPGGNVGIVYFGGQKYDVQATFDLPDKKLRAVRFSKPGYWKRILDGR